MVDVGLTSKFLYGTFFQQPKIVLNSIGFTPVIANCETTNMHSLIEGISDGTESGMRGPIVCCKHGHILQTNIQTPTFQMCYKI